MFRKSLTLTVLGMLVLSSLLVMPIFAQENWLVYFFNNKYESKELIRVKADGSQETYPLGAGQLAYINSDAMAFTSDGKYVAFCAFELDTLPVPTKTTTTVYVRDIAAQSNLLALPSTHCEMGHSAWSTDSQLLAISQLNDYPGDGEVNLDTTQPTWQLQILDARSGEVKYELNQQSPIIAAYDTLAKNSVIARVRQFDNHHLIFAALAYSNPVPSTLHWEGYQWNLDTNTVTAMLMWANEGVDVLPATGETVYAAKDPDRAGAISLIATLPNLPDNNVIKIINASGEERTIFHTTDWIVKDVKFIDDGTRVMIQLGAPLDPNTIAQPDKWIALDRAGHTEDLDSSYQVAVAAPGGYLSLYNAYDPQVTGSFVTTTWTYHHDGQSNDLFRSGVGAAESLTLAWVTPSVASDQLPPFPAI